METLTIGSILDVASFPDIPEIVDFTISLLNNRTDGWFDWILPNDVELRYTIADSACDQDVAVRALMDLLLTNNKKNDSLLPHCILGGRCSGPTNDLARICAALDIPICSPSASSQDLSNPYDYATFSRLMAPDNSKGQVGAMVSLLRTFHFEKISIIGTNTPYANAFELALQNAWEGEQEFGGDKFFGEIGYAGTVDIDQDSGEVDPLSVLKVFEKFKNERHKINSRVIVLLAHHQHAYPILKMAQELDFEPETVWVGLDGFADRPQLDDSWMPPHPGYLGLAPYRDVSGEVYQDFMARLQEDQRQRNRTVMSDLPDYFFDHTVDSILALTMALSSVTREDRRNGTLITAALSQLKFTGVSGPVEFDENGDRANPTYRVMAFPSRSRGWETVGLVKPGEKARITNHNIWCSPYIGCTSQIPSDRYELPSTIPSWGIALVSVLCILAVLFFAVSLLVAWYQKDRRIKKEKVKRLEERLSALDNESDYAREKKGQLYEELAELLGQKKPDHWTERHGVVSISPYEKKYWEILEELRSTMDDGDQCFITEIKEVQNVGLHSYYVFHKNKMANKYGITDLNDKTFLSEIRVWHGTSSLNPEVIYMDKQEGFMLNYAQDGLFGRGIYFAERSEYSDCYSYRVDSISPLESGWEHGDREMLLVKLLVGRDIKMDRRDSIALAETCRQLRTPPQDPSGLRYDTVSGFADDGTPIHVVYENGRAFPEFVVRYYKGPRNPSKTPFETFEEALAAKQQRDISVTTATANSISLTGHEGDVETVDHFVPPRIDTTDFLWTYQEDNGEFSPFHQDVQSEIEWSYRQNSRGCLSINSNGFTYNLNFQNHTQTNTWTGRQRTIRRIQLY